MFSCRNSALFPCTIADPTSDTVKVNLTMFAHDETDKENARPIEPTDAVNIDTAKVEAHKPQQLEQEATEAARREKEALEESKKLAAEEEERANREALEKEEQIRAAQEAEQWAAGQATLLASEELSRKEQEAQRKTDEEVRQLEKEKQQAEERRQKVEADRQELEAEQLRLAKADADEQRVGAFLKEKGFSGVNAKRRSMLKWKLPLHSAVEINDPELVRALLQCGADPSLANSSGQTALQSAAKRNKNGSHSSVLELLPGA